MGITHKNNVYSELVGVTHKLVGAYEAVQGVFVKAGGVYGRVDAETMALGMNVAWINSWSGAWVFSNLMYHASLTQASGTGTWSHDQGLVTTTDQNDVFRFLFSPLETALPAGDYTVLNPDGLEVEVGGYSPTGTWRTDTQFTFTRGSSGAAKCIFVKGDVTNAIGNLAVIAPGHLAKWQAGNVWHDDFLAFHQGIKCSPLRLMDWTWASNNIESDWAHRSVATKPTLHTYAADGQCVPYEFMCDLAARLNTDIWVCVPPRATQDYVEQMAALFAAQIPAGRKLWLELGNEIWNTADPWGDGTEWINYLDHTRRTAAADVTNQKFVLAGHGLSNAAEIRSFATIENRSARADRATAWRLRMGQPSYVKVLNVNEFELYSDVGLTSKITIPAGQVNHLFVVVAEGGKTAAMNTHYGELSLRNWDAFNAEVGATNIRHLVAAQATSTATTAGRLAVSGVSDRVDYVAIAPYFDGTWYGTRVTAASGSLTVGVWASANITVSVGIYASGSTPSTLDVIDGTGAVSSQTINYTAGSDAYTDAAALTGLTNDAAYDVHLVVEVDGLFEHLEGIGTPSVAGSTGYIEPSYAQQQTRNTQTSSELGAVRVESHIAVSGGVPLVCYEGGLHYHQAAPAQLDTWLAGYQESDGFAAAIRADLQLLADAGAEAHCYYGDSLGTTFAIANGYTDVTDKRYLVFDGLNGRIAKRTLLGVADVVADNIESDPGAFPATVATLPRSDLTYTLISGDLKGNYAISGNVLQIVNDSQIEWTSPSNVSLVVQASDGATNDFFTVSFATGSAWYEIDAKFAWDSIADSDNAQIDPTTGNTLSLLAGSGAVVADGLWDMDGDRYGSASGSISSISLNTPLLIAAVLDKDNQSSTYVPILTVGTGNFAQFRVSANATAEFNFQLLSGSGGVNNTQLAFSGATPAGKHVFWAYYDAAASSPYVRIGIDQTETNAQQKSHAGQTLNTAVYVGGSASTTGSQMKHGSMQFVSRSGMTLADAKAIVAKMQTLHGIA